MQTSPIAGLVRPHALSRCHGRLTYHFSVMCEAIVRWLGGADLGLEGAFSVALARPKMADWRSRSMRDGLVHVLECCSSGTTLEHA